VISKRVGKRRSVVIALFACALSGCVNSIDAEGIDTQATDPDKSSGPGNSKANSAPTISGHPAPAVRTADNYSFTPSASDPDGDKLTFAVENLPRWASFDTKRGVLSGRPLPGDEGVYERIRISVSDGQNAASLLEFSITVTEIALASVTLSWTPPTENSDGSNLTDLSAYKIYYGVSSGNYYNQIRIDNPGLSTYVVENLIPGTYYFAATAVNSFGVESEYSNEARKVAN